MPIKPSWANRTQSFWGPHVITYQGKFILYYSAMRNDDEGMAIGVAIAESPEGPYQDVGQPLLMGSGYSHIDPFVFEDFETGKAFLFWGSDRSPIFAQQLSDDRTHLQDGSHSKVVLEPDLIYPYEELIEAPWIIKRNDWYYLFYSGDFCCGKNAHYALLIARSRNILGPYQRMAEVSKDKSSVILKENEHWHALGHNAIFTDLSGVDWLFYHAIEPANPSILVAGEEFGSRRVLLVDRIAFTEGNWPSFPAVSPSIITVEGPFIGEYDHD
jgi:arabinan endo-1,5-alpha-L-arabinosidase